METVGATHGNTDGTTEEEANAQTKKDGAKGGDDQVYKWSATGVRLRRESDEYASSLYLWARRWVHFACTFKRYGYW